MPRDTYQLQRLLQQVVFGGHFPHALERGIIMSSETQGPRVDMEHPSSFLTRVDMEHPFFLFSYLQQITAQSTVVQSQLICWEG